MVNGKNENDAAVFYIRTASGSDRVDDDKGRLVVTEETRSLSLAVLILQRKEERSLTLLFSLKLLGPGSCYLIWTEPGPSR